MMGLVPTPPTCKKPQLNWSLLRRYSLIAPAISIPSQCFEGNRKLKQRSLEDLNELHTETENANCPKSCDQTKRNPFLVNPKLLKLPDIKYEMPITEPITHATEPLSITKTDGGIPSLIRDTTQFLPKNTDKIALVRVPTSYLQAGSHYLTRDIIQMIEPRPLLQLPTTTGDIPSLREASEFRLLSVEQLTSMLPTSSGCGMKCSAVLTNSLFLQSWKPTVIPDAGPIKLLDLRNQMRIRDSNFTFAPLQSEFNTTQIRNLSENVNFKSDPDFKLLRFPKAQLKENINSTVCAGTTDLNRQHPHSAGVSSSSLSSTPELEKVTTRMDLVSQKNLVDLGVQTFEKLTEDKPVYTVTCQDFGMQFDDILEEDAFIFKNYVIGRDGVRHVSDVDRECHPEPLVHQDILLGANADSSVNPAKIADILQNNFMDEENQFLSICSIELSEWDAEEPTKPRVGVTTPVHLSRILRTHSFVRPDGGNQFIQRPVKFEAESHYDSIHQNQAGDTQLAVQEPIFQGAQSCTIKQEPTEIWSGGRPVVKAFHELDARLSAMDRISNRLGEEHRKNQELLERLIQLSSARKSSLPEQRTADEQPQQYDQLNANESNTKPCKSPDGKSVVPEEKQTISPDNRLSTTTKPRVPRLQRPLGYPARHASLGGKQPNSTQVIRSRALSMDRPSSGFGGPNNVGVIVTSLNSGTVDTGLGMNGGRGSAASSLIRGSRRASIGSLARKREQARIERKSALSAKRCEEVIKLVDEVLHKPELPDHLAHSNKTKDPNDLRDLNPISTSPGHSRQSRTRGSRKPITTFRSGPNTQRSASKRRASSSVRKRKVPAVRKFELQPKSTLTFEDFNWDEENEQTTIISEWSLESNVKRLLYEPNIIPSMPKSHTNQQVAEACDGTLLIEPKKQRSSVSLESNFDAEQLTDGGAAVSSSFIDWEEVNELVRDS